MITPHPSLLGERPIPDIIARALVNHYRDELATAAAPEAPGFSVARVLHSVVKRTPLTGRDAEIVDAASQLAGDRFSNPNRLWIPFSAMRTMQTTTGASGGYSVGVDVGSPLDMLRPWSVVASAGVMGMNGLKSNFTAPRVTGGISVSWIGEGATGPDESPPTLGQASMAPRLGIGLVKLSIQLIRQAEAAEPLVRQLLLSAIGQAIDTVFFAGAGGVQPLGLFNTTGHNVVSGTSLDVSDLLSMRRKVLDAGGREEALRWVGSPAVQETLGGRERTSGGGRMLWDDNGVLGRPAYATATAPAAGLVCGDFSQALVGVWGPGVRIDIDPSQDFERAGLVARVMVMVDVAFPQPAAFSVAASVS